MPSETPRTAGSGEARRAVAKTRKRQRDALLAVSGQLDLRVGGPSFQPLINPEALEGLSNSHTQAAPSPASEQGRRSLYMSTPAQPGSSPDDHLRLLRYDPALRRTRHQRRRALEALALLNGAFAHEQSRRVAELVLVSASQDRGLRSKGPGGESSRVRPARPKWRRPWNTWSDRRFGFGAAPRPTRWPSLRFAMS